MAAMDATPARRRRTSSPDLLSSTPEPDAVATPATKRRRTMSPGTRGSDFATPLRRPSTTGRRSSVGSRSLQRLALSEKRTVDPVAKKQISLGGADIEPFCKRIARATEQPTSMKSSLLMLGRPDGAGGELQFVFEGQVYRVKDEQALATMLCAGGDFATKPKQTVSTLRAAQRSIQSSRTQQPEQCMPTPQVVPTVSLPTKSPEELALEFTRSECRVSVHSLLDTEKITPLLVSDLKGGDVSFVFDRKVYRTSEQMMTNTLLSEDGMSGMRPKKSLAALRAAQRARAEASPRPARCGPAVLPSRPTNDEAPGPERQLECTLGMCKAMAEQPSQTQRQALLVTHAVSSPGGVMKFAFGGQLYRGNESTVRSMLDEQMVRDASDGVETNPAGYKTLASLRAAQRINALDQSAAGSIR